MKLRLDELEKKQKILTKELQQTDEQIKALQGSKNQLTKDLGVVKQQLNSLSQTKPIQITDHVLLRYLERNQGIDLAEIKTKLLTPELQKMVDTLGGTGTYPVGEGHVVLQNFVIVTYLDAE